MSSPLEHNYYGRTLDVPHSFGSAPPEHALPAGAVDAHHHIFDTRFNGCRNTIATVQDYILLKERLGITKSIVVAPYRLGQDNSCLIDALSQFGDQARGVIMPSHLTLTEDLRPMHTLGVRGLRYYLGKGPLPEPELLTQVAKKLADIGWHIQIMAADASVILAYQECFAHLPCPVVFDHLALVPQPDGKHHPIAEAIYRLLDTKHVYVKLSGVYLTSEVGFPNYDDVDELARSYVNRAPNRVLWGTDWPHTLAGPQKPDGAELVNQIWKWAPDPAERQLMLVDNPNELYW